jgi:ABC-2 type transport system permease protein
MGAVRLLSILHKAWAFIRRDMLIEMSYRSAFVLQFGGVFVSVGIWYFLSGMIRGFAQNMKGLEGGDYFPFILVGIAFYHYLTVALTSFASRVRNEQLTGTLEAMLVTPTRTPMVILASSLWDFVFTSFRVVVYLAVGVVISRMTDRPIHLYWSGLLPFAVILGLTILAFCGIGIIVASVVIYLKKGEPINSFIISASALLGGVFYPVDSMPPWLAKASALLPITYALKGIRGALLSGASFGELLPEIQVLALFVAALVPIGLLVFRWALRGARRDGTLVQY